MHFTSLAAISLASVATAAPHLAARSNPAPKVTDNPNGAWAEARFSSNDGSQVSGTHISGYVRAYSQGMNQPVRFEVMLDNLPEDGGDHLYHIHVNQVPSDGNCTGTGAHLDPENRGEMPPCDSSQPATCQVGDLAGKHGNLKGQNYQQSYEDWYVSLDPSDAAYFGDRSVTIHKADTTRIACTDWKMYGGSGNDNDNEGTGDVFQYSGGNGGDYNGGFNGDYNGQNDATASAAASAAASASTSTLDGAWSGFKNKFPILPF